MTFEHGFLIAAYERAVEAVLGHPWAFDTEEYGVEQRVDAIVSTHCARKEDSQGWLEGVVGDFVRAKRSDPSHVKGYGPKVLLDWLNAGRPGSRRTSKTPEATTKSRDDDDGMTTASPTVRDGVASVLAALKGGGGAPT